MNLWIKPAGLFFVAALFAITGCQETGEIGLDLDPERGRFVVRYAEFPLRNAVVQIDSVYSRNAANLVTGYYRHPDFGNVQATAFTRMFLNQATFMRDSAAVLDSLILQIRVRYIYGGDYTQSQQLFYVHELSEVIPDTSHFTKTSTPFYPEALAVGQFEFPDYDSEVIDTLLNFRLSDELGQRFLLASLDTGSQVFTDQDAFQEFFNGIAIRADEGNTAAIGADMNFPNTRLTLHYHSDRDTLLYSFSFVAFQGQLNISNYYHNITTDRNGTPLQGLPGFHQEYQPENGLSYAQGGAGLLTKVSLAPVFNFMDTIESIVINRAELYIKTQPFEPHFRLPVGLELYITDDSNGFILSGGAFRAVRNEDGAGTLVMRPQYNPSTMATEYVGNISLYTQGIIERSNPDSLLLITPTNLTFYLNQLVARQSDILLRLHYSTIN